MINTKASIIIPAWNSAQYIKEAITSALKQKTFYPYEVIIVDDGSTDETGKIVDEIGNPLIRYFKTLHLGQGAAKNFGVENSKSDLITILDADDALDKNALNIVVKYFDKHPEVLYAYSEHLGTDENLQVIYKTDKKSYQKIYQHRWKEDLILHCCFYGHIMAIKKLAFEKIGYFDENLKVGVDYDWILKFTEKYQPGYIPAYIYFYREQAKGTNKLINRNPRLIESIIEKSLVKREIGKRKVTLKGRDEVGYRIYEF